MAVTWFDWLWPALVFAIFVLAPPSFIYIFLFKPEKLVARRGRAEQRHFYSAKWSGRKWTDEEIDSIPGSSLRERLLGAKYSEFVRYAVDDPERLPRAIMVRRIHGILLLLFWLFATTIFLCMALLGLNQLVP